MDREPAHEASFSPLIDVLGTYARTGAQPVCGRTRRRAEVVQVGAEHRLDPGHARAAFEPLETRWS